MPLRFPNLYLREIAGNGDGGFRRLMRAATADRGITAYVLLTLLCALTFGAGLSALPPTDRDESRFMQATKQMIETGDYVHIKVQDDPRRKKPIGIHWLQAASVNVMGDLFGEPINVAWPYRLPSVLAAWATVLLICAAGRRLFGGTAGLIAGAMMATLPLAVVEAHIAKTDAALLGLSTLAMTLFSGLYADHVAKKTSPLWRTALFWLACGGAILIKGPLIILIAGATLATLCLQERDSALIHHLRPIWGIALAALVVAPWIVALTVAGDLSFFADAVREDVLPKLMGGQESHGAPPGTYLLVTLLSAWPWSLVIPLALIVAWPDRQTPAVRFCLAWLIPAWLVFEAVPTKLPHYILPLLPAAALLVGAAAQNGLRLRLLLDETGTRIWAGLWAVLSIAIGAGVVWASMTYGAATLPAAVVGAAAAVAAALLALMTRRRGTAARICGQITLAAAVFCITVPGIVAPHLNAMWVSPRLAVAVNRLKPTGPVVLVGFHEPSAVFLLGTKTRLSDAAGAAGIIAAEPSTIVAIDARDVPAFTAAVTDLGRAVSTMSIVDGFNYADGQSVSMHVVKTAP